MKQANKKLDWIVGKWESLDDTGSVVFEISKTPRGLRVTGFDKGDGEKLIVSKTKWDGTVLRFETFMPSTKWRTKNVLTPVSRVKILQELTFTLTRPLTPPEAL